MKTTHRVGVLAALAVGMLALGACSNIRSLECKDGLVQCGDRCIDPQSDEGNCGGCGIACGTLQVCGAGTCGCREGTESCDGVCSDLTLDDRNCGACGNACGNGQVCEASSCGGAVVVAACGGTAQVVSVGRDGTPGTPVQLGTSGLQALGVYERNVLAASYGSEIFQFGPEVTLTAATLPGFMGANHILSEPPYVYVTNTNANSVVVAKQTGGSAEAGYAFTKVGEVPLGDNTVPQAAVRVGSRLYVPLYGNLFTNPGAGQRVAVLDVTNPESPVRVPAEDIDLAGLDLQPFAGLTPFPTPYGIIERGGNLYLPLNSYTADYQVGGPGLLAKITLPDGQASAVELDPETCVNVGDVAKVGDLLVVSCVGSTTYDAEWNPVAVEKTSVLLLDANDSVVDSYAFTCTAPDCAAAAANRLAVWDSRVYVGDGMGRLVVLDVRADGFSEVRGISATATRPPAQVCPPSETASNHVADLVVVQ